MRGVQHQRSQIISQPLAQRQLRTVAASILERITVTIRIKDLLHAIVAAGRIAVAGNRKVSAC